MSFAMSDYLETHLLEHVLKNVSWTSPATVYLALFTSATDEASGGTEVAGNAYARQSVAWNAAASPAGTISNSGLITFPTATPLDWGTITDIGIYDAFSGGNRLLYGTLAASKTINAGDRIEFLAGSIVVTFD